MWTLFIASYITKSSVEWYILPGFQSRRQQDFFQHYALAHECNSEWAGGNNFSTLPRNFITFILRYLLRSAYLHIHAFDRCYIQIGTRGRNFGEPKDMIDMLSSTCCHPGPHGSRASYISKIQSWKGGCTLCHIPSTHQDNDLNRIQAELRARTRAKVVGKPL